MSTGTRGRSIRSGAVALTILTMLAACGSQIPAEELSAAYYGSATREFVPREALNDAPAAGATDAPAAGATDAAAAGPTDAADPAADATGDGGAPAAAVAGGTATESVDDSGAVAGGSSPGGGGGGDACTGNEEPVTFGAVGSQSGVLGALLAPAPKTVQAWAESVNAAGGLNCHEVRYIIADDNNDPARHQTLVRQLVEDQGVIAFVAMNSGLVGGASVSYLEERKIPVVGGTGPEAWAYDSPMWFPHIASGKWIVQQALHASASAAVSRGLTRLGIVVCVESSTCTEAPELADESLAGTGVDLVYSGQASLTQPDYSAVCTAASRAEAQILLLILDPASNKRLARSCKGVSYEPIYSMQGSVSPETIADPGFEGMVFAGAWRPWVDTGHPAVARYIDALERFGGGLQPQGVSMGGWTAAMLLEAAVGDRKDITSETIIQGLHTLEDPSIGDLIAPVRFSPGKPAEPSVCYWPQKVTGGKPSADGSRVCVDPLSR